MIEQTLNLISWKPLEAPSLYPAASPPPGALVVADHSTDPYLAATPSAYRSKTERSAASEPLPPPSTPSWTVEGASPPRVLAWPATPANADPNTIESARITAFQRMERQRQRVAAYLRAHPNGPALLAFSPEGDLVAEADTFAALRAAAKAQGGSLHGALLRGRGDADHYEP